MKREITAQQVHSMLVALYPDHTVMHAGASRMSCAVRLPVLADRTTPEAESTFDDVVPKRMQIENLPLYGSFRFDLAIGKRSRVILWGNLTRTDKEATRP